MKKKMQAIIFAADKAIPYTYPLCGQPMILHNINLLNELSVPVTVIYRSEDSTLSEIIKKAGANSYEITNEMCNTILFPNSSILEEQTLILKGNSPLLTRTLLEKFIKHHLDSCLCISTIEQSEIYLLEKTFLRDMQSLIKNELFDMAELLRHAYQQDLKCNLVALSGSSKTYTVSTLSDLYKAEYIMRKRLIKEWTKKGVRFTCGESTYLDTTIHIGAGSLIEEGVRITDGSHIGNDCTVGAYARLNKTVVGDRTTILPFSIINESNIGEAAQIGPFAHLQKTSVAEKSVIGNFVEVKRSTIGAASKAKHLAYIGDTHMGNGVNIGAGTIICNYDGTQKHTTVIKDHAFIGSNNTLVAPITVEENSFTAAGSTITKDVPRNSLAIGRSIQLNKLEYAERILKKEQKTSKLKKRVDEHLSTKEKCFIGAKRTTHDPSEPDLV